MLRFASATPPADFLTFFGVPAPELYTPRYNLAPTQFTPLVRRGEHGEREAVLARWGLVPAHSRTPAHATRLHLTHARAESVLTSATYTEAFRARRALIPISGYYSWVGAPSVLTDRPGKQPHYVHRRDDKPLVLAALWTRWTGRGGPLDSFAVVTVAAGADVRHLDGRMPAVLLRRDWNAWLDPATPCADARALLRPFPSGVLSTHPVTREVGNLRLDDPRLLQPVA